MTISRRALLQAMAAGSAVPTMDRAAAAGSVSQTDDESLLAVGVVELAEAIRARRISSLEAVNACLRRIGRVNGALNAVVQLRSEAALAEAQAADRGLARGRTPGALHGVPFTIKDSFDTAGVATTAGIKGREHNVPARDATVVARLRAAGAILLGKTNTPELTLSFETSNAVYGRTSNPYDPARTSGGSSGGAAAIVAAAGSPFDIGSDTGGSIRLPAHFCGIAGLKPTAGRVSRTGNVISWGGPTQALTQVGPLARRVADLALVLTVIAGPDGIDPFVETDRLLPDPRGVPLRGLRVAWFADNGIAPVSAETATTLENAVRALAEAGASLREARPGPLAESYELYVQLIRADGGAGLRRLLRRLGVTDSPFLRGGGRAMSVEDYTALLERWDDFRSRMLPFWRDHDALLCPVNAHPAIEHGAMGREGGMQAYSYTMTDNLTGWPAVVVRCGSSAGGLPIGLQVVAPPWREDRCLAVAGRLEAALVGWQRPGL